MPHFALSTFVAVAILSTYVYAQSSGTPTTTTVNAVVTDPLADKHFDYNNLVRLLFPLPFQS